MNVTNTTSTDSNIAIMDEKTIQSKSYSLIGMKKDDENFLQLKGSHSLFRDGGYFTASIRNFRQAWDLDRRRSHSATYTEPLDEKDLLVKEFTNTYYKFEMIFELCEEIEMILLKHRETVGEHYKKLVPSFVSFDEFWLRYFFRTVPYTLERDFQTSKMKKSIHVNIERVPSIASLVSPDQSKGTLDTNSVMNLLNNMEMQHQQCSPVCHDIDITDAKSIAIAINETSLISQEGSCHGKSRLTMSKSASFRKLLKLTNKCGSKKRSRRESRPICTSAIHSPGSSSASNISKE